MASSKSSASTALAFRQRFGARLMLVAMAVATALFWAGVIRLLFNT